MKTIYFDTSQPIFNTKFKNALTKWLTWAKSKLVHFFSTSDPIWLTVHENDLFWYITTIFYMKFLNENPNRLNWALMSWKWAGNHFFLILTPFYSQCSQTTNFDVPHYELLMKFSNDLPILLNKWVLKFEFRKSEKIFLGTCRTIIQRESKKGANCL